MFLPFISHGAFASFDMVKTDSKITDVTVFFNGAQISRTAEAVLTKGKQIVVFENLPVDIDAESIRMSGCDDCLIQSINHKFDYVIDDLPEEEKLREEIKAFRYKITHVNNEMNTLVHQENLLHKNNNFVNSKTGADINQLKQAADFYGKKIVELRAEKLDLSRKVDQLTKERIELFKKLNKERAKTNRITSKIEMMVTAPAAGKRTITAQYYTTTAGWYPTYDFRVKDVNEPLNITYNANVYQSSGEDWKNIKIKLSTSDPQLSSTKPQLEPWIIENSKNIYLFEESNKPGAVSGVIKDAQTHDQLPFVRIVVKDRNKRVNETFTDADGRFLIKPIAKGNVTVEAEYFGYGNDKKRITVNPDETAVADFFLTPLSIETREVDVVEYSAPLIYKDSRFNNQEDAEMLVERSAVRVATTVGGVYSQDDGTSDLRLRRKRIKISNDLQENVSHLEYTIHEPYTILSTGEDYNISIKEVETDVDYTYYSVPKMEQAAFLTARIDEPAELNLLPAKVSIYFDDTYIGETEIGERQLQDTLEISLGRDNNLVIKRTGSKELREKRFLSNNNVQTTGWEIETRNNKRSPVTIVIQDQYPLAQRSSVDVELHSGSGAEVDPKKGELQWRMTIEPGETKKVNFGYTVKYPRGLFGESR